MPFSTVGPNSPPYRSRISIAALPANGCDPLSAPAARSFEISNIVLAIETSVLTGYPSPLVPARPLSEVSMADIDGELRNQHVFAQKSEKRRYKMV